MTLPTRPVADAVVATDWGQAIHDYTFAPAGCIVHGSVALEMAAAAAYSTLYLDTVDDDPGGYLDAAFHRIDVPTGGGGLYQLVVTCSTDNGDAADETRVDLMLNGSQITRAQVGQEGATAVWFSLTWAGVLAAGDLIHLRALQVGSNARADVRVRSCVLVRIGAEMGSPT